MAESLLISRKATNLLVARILPLILTGIVGYVTWVVTVEVCGKSPEGRKKLMKVDFLLQTESPRPGTAATILVLYFLLLLLMAWAYFRLLYVVTFHPGYVERDYRHGAKRETISEKSGNLRQAGPPRRSEEGPSLAPYIGRSAYICQGDGRPLWCTSCQNWKPDRAHHCRECDRCVRKMDHFCPWVGGVVSETSFKFFIQFVSWTFLFCLLNLIHLAVFLAQSRRDGHGVNVHWIVALAFAALFGAFTAGMSGTSFQFALQNTTTIENLSRKSIVYQIAIHLPEPPQEKPPYTVVSFALPQAENTIRTFAILRTRPGDNPWDQGWKRNFCEVMGHQWYDWLLPIRMSPCSVHDLVEAEFPFGPVVDQLWNEAQNSTNGTAPTRRKRRRRRRSKPTSS